MNENNRPRIRFKGFTDSWKRYNLGELMDVTSVKRIHQSDWKDSGIRFLRARDIVSAFKNESPNSYLYISKEKYDEYSIISGKVNVGDMLVTGVGTIGIPLLIRNYEPLYFKDGNIIWFKNGEKIEGNFFYYSFLGNKIKNFINESAGIGTVGTYTIDSGKKTPILLPSPKEQTKIGIFLEKLDNLTNLYQLKYEKLKNIKKSMLENLFPKIGNNTPEIRFKGFTDSWKQCKLGELLERVLRKNLNNESSLPLTISAQYGLVDQTTYFNSRVASHNVSNYYLILNGEFAYNKSTSAGFPYGTVKRLDLYEKGVLSTLYIVFRIKNEKKINSDFLNIFFDTDRWHRGVAERAAEGARNHGLLNISVEDFFDIDIYISKQEKEQEKIGLFFKQLDNLITFHQHKYEKLKNIKKSMLDKMFV